MKIRDFVCLLALTASLAAQGQIVIEMPENIGARADREVAESDDDEARGDLGLESADTSMVTLDALQLADSAAITGVPWPQNVQQKLTRLTESRLFETSQVAVMVYDLTADSALFAHNARQLMRPASVEKLITAISALDRLGGNYQLRTALYYTGQISGNTLNGDLYCVGGFDPAFSDEDMRAFAESVRQLGIDTLRGRIVADLSMKDDKKYGEGWCWDDDNHTLTPLLINKKDQFLDRFKSQLRGMGITLDGGTLASQQGRLPNGARTLCTRFHSIDQILLKMMKESDNLYAEALFYQLAAAAGSRPASAKHARGLIKNLIKKTGLTPGDYKIADGCGLSLYNYTSAELLCRLMRYAWRSENLYAHLLPALPIAGEDGTLRKRMKGTAAEGNVRAKTGTLTAISTLAGYCRAANGHELCFAILNQGLIHESNGRAFQDRVCTALCE